MRAGALLVCLASSLVGCSALFDYPQPRAENSSPFCGDGIDNDYDGRVDCADLDCADSRDCTRREDPADCRDEQDNDRDGYPDRADPLCWHLFASDPWERCVTARTTELYEEFDGPATTRWFSNDALAPRVVARPLGDGRADTVASLVPGPRSFSVGTVSSLLGEMRLRGSLRVPVGASAALQLWAATATPSASEIRESGLLAEVALARTEAGLALTVTRGIDVTGPVSILDGPEEDAWVPVVVDVRCGRTLEVNVAGTIVSAGTGDCTALSTLPAYAPLGPLAGQPIRVGLLATAGQAWLDDLSFTGVGSHTCGSPRPHLTTGPGAVGPPSSPRVLSIASSGDPEHLAGLIDDEDGEDCDEQEPPYLCALVLDRATGRVEPWVSREMEGTAWPRLGERFTRGAPLPPGSVIDASVEWTWMGTCTEQRWRATVRTPSAVTVYASEDCMTWTPEAYFLADLADEWDWHAYFVRAANGDQRIPQREEVYAARRGTSGLVFGRAYRQRNLITWTNVAVLNGDRPAAELRDLTFPITLSRVGTIDQVITGHGTELGLVVHVIPAGIGEEVLAWQGGGLDTFEYTATIEPSGLEGTADRWDIESGAVAVARESDGNTFALALYTADGDHRAEPDGHAPSVGIACRQISFRNPPCEQPAQIVAPGRADGFCFRDESCLSSPAFDCGYPCFDNPQDVRQLASDHPATAHASGPRSFHFVAAPEPTRASAPIRASPSRAAIHFDVMIDGPSDACAVRVGVGHSVPIPDRGPVGEMAEIAVEGDLVRYRAFTRARDGAEVLTDDPTAVESHRGRWQHILLMRTDEGLEVWGRELDVQSTWELHTTAPRGPADASTLWIEVPGTTASCRGRIRNVVIDDGVEAPP